MKTIIDFANKVKSLVDGRMSNIANVEESPSTRAYAVGKQLIFNGLLCKATSAISVGDTLAVGTNLALSDNVVEQIYSLNQGLTNSLANLSHENLLDNPWFTVNQRGQSSYTDPGNGKYTVDRWKIYNYNTLTVSSNGVSSIGLFQYFEEDRVKPLLGKTVTLSILFQDGRIRYSSGQLPNAFPSVDTAYIETNVGDNTWIYITLSSSKLLQVQIRNWSNQVIDVRAVKLEFGSVSTLAMDTAPNYATELLKCQRYFVRFNPTDSYTAFGAGIYSSNHVFAEVTLPTVLRAKPNVSYLTIRAHSYGRNEVNISSIIVNNYINNIVSLKCAPGSGANFVNGDYCEIQLDINNYLDVSCEL